MKATTHAAPTMGRTQRQARQGYVCPATRICSTGVSDESVRRDVRTTLPVKAARPLDRISTGVAVIRGPGE